MISTDLGAVTAYAYAVSKDYPGTEDEFAQDMANVANVASLYPADTSLSIAGKAADAYATGNVKDAVFINMEASITELVKMLNRFSSKTYTTIVMGWKLGDDGLAYQDSGYALVKYAVSARDILIVNAPHKFQFQNGETVSSSSSEAKIGAVFSGFDGAVVVPDGADYLILSTQTTASYYVGGCVSSVFTYHGTMSAGAYTQAKEGVYSVTNANVTGLPSGMTQAYGWLVCLSQNNLYVLFESTTTKVIWLKEGSSDWVKIFPDDKNRFEYHGALASGSYTQAEEGIYAVNNANVTGLPSGMTQAYGWLVCFVKENLYLLFESTASKIVWMKESINDWVEIYPSNTYHGRLRNKLIAYNGDSICESRMNGYSSNGGGYPYLIANIVHGTYENRGSSGGTLAISSASHNVCNDVSLMSSSADIICFEGGINDYWLNVPLGDYSESDFTENVDQTTVCGALESIFRQAINRWVGKPIVFIIVHKITTTAWTKNSAPIPYTFEELREKMLGICKKYSIPVLDMWAEGGLNAYMSALDNAFLNGGSNTHPDGCHPDVNGYKKYYVPKLIALFDTVLPYGD